MVPYAPEQSASSASNGGTQHNSSPPPSMTPAPPSVLSGAAPGTGSSGAAPGTGSSGAAPPSGTQTPLPTAVTAVSPTVAPSTTYANLGDSPDLRASSLYINRELSWLEFNARVLSEAESDSVPLLERLKFMSIFSSNLDEFFMVRLAGLKQQLTGEVGEIPADGMTVSEQLNAISGRVHELAARQDQSLRTVLLPKLAELGNVLVKPERLGPEALAGLDKRFHEEVFPILTPIAIDPGHPFPHLRNKSLNLGVMFMREGQLEAGFGVVQVPMMLPRLLEVTGMKSADGSVARHAYVLLEDLIARHVETIFPACGKRASTPSASRATSTSRSTRKKRRTSCRRSSRSSGGASAAMPVRLEVTGDPTPASLAKLVKALKLESRARRVPLDRRAQRLRSHDHLRARRPPRAARRAGGAAAGGDLARLRGRVRDLARGRRPGAPAVRVVRQPGRSHHPRGRRSRRPRDQADAVSRRWRFADREGARARRGRIGQAGHGDRRAQGALRRGVEHRLGAHPRAVAACTWSTASSA